jgi:hypothetical protein
VAPPVVMAGVTLSQRVSAVLARREVEVVDASSPDRSIVRKRRSRAPLDLYRLLAGSGESGTLTRKLVTCRPNAQRRAPTGRETTHAHEATGTSRWSQPRPGPDRRESGRVLPRRLDLHEPTSPAARIDASPGAPMDSAVPTASSSKPVHVRGTDINSAGATSPNRQ